MWPESDTGRRGGDDHNCGDSRYTAAPRSLRRRRIGVHLGVFAAERGDCFPNVLRLDVARLRRVAGEQRAIGDEIDQTAERRATPR